MAEILLEADNVGLTYHQPTGETLAVENTPTPCLKL